jgi:hypothetical protein
MVLLYRKPVPQVKNRKKYKKEALKRLFSFEKKKSINYLTTSVETLEYSVNPRHSKPL